jgi:hypothetical protein
MVPSRLEKKQQYIVFLDHPGLAPQLTGVKQSRLEKNLSTPTRKVVTLAPSEADTLQSLIPGVSVFENRKVSVPTPKQLTAGTDAVLNHGVPAHGADKLHAMGIKGNSSKYAPIVVTIDTGVAPHKDLQVETRGLATYDVTKKKEGVWYDGHGHGTHVKGIQAAKGDVTGILPEAQFIAIRVLDDRGSGSFATVLAGIEKAAEYYDKFCKDTGRTMFVNLSLGGTAGPVSQDAIHKAFPGLLESRPGLEFTFAAGNSGPRAETINTPGNIKHERSVTVAAVDAKGTPAQDNDEIATFSSRGGKDVAKGQDALRVGGLGGIGVNVNSTWKDNGYKVASGTSMGSPNVNGRALLADYAGWLYEAGKLSVTPQQINYAALARESANDHANIPADAEGLGELQLDKAAELLLQKYGKSGATLWN